MIKNYKHRDNIFVHFLENVLSYQDRKFLGFIFGSISLFFIFASVLLKISSYDMPTYLAYISSVFLSFLDLIPGISVLNHSFYDLNVLAIFKLQLSSALGIWNGVMLMSLSVYFLIKLLNIYSHIINFKYIYSNFCGLNDSYNHVVLSIQEGTSYGDLIRSFLRSNYVLEMLYKAGVSENDIFDYLNTRTDVCDFSDVIQAGKIKNLEDLIKLIYKDSSFKNFIESKGLSVDSLIDSSRFLDSHLLSEHIKNYQSSVAFTLKYKTILNFILIGNSIYIKKFLKPFSLLSKKTDEIHTNINITKLKVHIAEKKNVLLVEDNVFSGDYLISQLITDSLFKTSFSSTKVFYYFDLNIFENTSCDYINDLRGIFDELNSIKEIVLVIRDYDKYINFLKNIFSDEEISKYLNSGSFNILAIINNKNFNPSDNLYCVDFDIINCSYFPNDFVYLSILSKFEFKDEDELNYQISTINEAIINISKSEKNSLLSITKKTLLSFLDQAIEPNSFKKNKDDMFCKSADKIRLIEDALRSNIIGQENAISSLAKVISRSDRTNKIPSILILGPDEDLKRMLVRILSYFMFGDNSAIFELDMEEYKADDSLFRILNGDLKTLKKYLKSINRVLVLNNYEKSHPSVKELFKQIIKTGVINYNDGTSIDCGNLVIVAFSSVGTIEVSIKREDVSSGKYSSLYSEVVEGAIKRGILDEGIFDTFEGELLFRHFTESEHREIAKVLLKNLAKSIQKNGYTLIINEYLISTVVKFGIDPSYGILPMKKAITDVIYSKIKEKISKGELLKGDRIEFSSEL